MSASHARFPFLLATVRKYSAIAPSVWLFRPSASTTRARLDFSRRNSAYLNDERQNAVRPEYAGAIVDEGDETSRVLYDLAGDDPVEPLVGKIGEGLTAPDIINLLDGGGIDAGMSIIFLAKPVGREMVKDFDVVAFPLGRERIVARPDF